MAICTKDANHFMSVLFIMLMAIMIFGNLLTLISRSGIKINIMLKNQNRIKQTNQLTLLCHKEKMNYD